MRKELMAYRKKIDAVIANSDDGYYEGIVEDHLNQIAFSNMSVWYILLSR